MGATDKFTVLLETVSLNATELSANCRERRLFPEQVDRWRQTAQDANATSLLNMAEQRDLEKLRIQDHKEVKRLQKELQTKEISLMIQQEFTLMHKSFMSSGDT